MTRRYVSIRAVCEHKLTQEQLHAALYDSVLRYFGEFGYSRIDPKIMRFDADSSTGVISCERKAAPDLESILSLMTEYSGGRLTVLVLGVSGTIKGAGGRELK